LVAQLALPDGCGRNPAMIVAPAVAPLMENAADAIQARIAVYTGALDPYAPLEHVDAFSGEMTAARARWQLTVFSEAYHAFTDAGAANIPVPGVAYDPVAHHTSWTGTLPVPSAML
jgi:dienelactone hydrolase